MAATRTRKEIIERANAFGLNVEVHSPGGVASIYTFAPTGWTIKHSESGLSNAEAFVDGWVFAVRARAEQLR